MWDEKEDTVAIYGQFYAVDKVACVVDKVASNNVIMNLST